METLYTTEFDNDLQNQLPHFKNYPELLPFIGKYWNESPYKILVIAESHYIATKDIQKEQLENWYDYSSSNFKQYESDPFQLHRYINTRYNVNNAFLINKNESQRPYMHYYNMRRAIKQNIEFFKVKDNIFDYLAYYNYFQRPAYIEGESIINNDKDDKIAFDTFINIVDIVKPEKIIFVSSKSYHSFKNNKDLTKQIMCKIPAKIYTTPHPGSAWWNRRSKNYGKNIKTNEYRTGREKFIEIITSKI